MLLFCAAIWKDLVSLRSLHFRSPFRVFSCRIPQICPLKYPCSCFSSRFCFLDFVVFCFCFWFVYLFIYLFFFFFVLVVSRVTGRCYSFSLLFVISSSNTQIDASTHSSLPASPLSLSFLDTYNLSISSLIYKAICIVINFLVPWTITVSFCLVDFMNGSK